jgi:hypothetical protein
LHRIIGINLIIPRLSGSGFNVPGEKHPTSSYQRDPVLIVFIMPFHPMGDVGYYRS